MLKVWATLASVLLTGSAFGQSVEMETGAPMPAPPPCVECAPSCWSLNLNIPKRPLRTWLSCCESVQKCKEFFSYYPGHRGICGCCLKPDPVIPPPLYTYFWPVHCADGHCGPGCAPHGIWNENVPVASEGFASAGVAVGTAQTVQAVQVNQEQPWYKAMFTRARKDQQPAGMIVPVSNRTTR